MANIKPLAAKKNNFPIIAVVTLLILVVAVFGYIYVAKPDAEPTPTPTPTPTPVVTDQKYSNDTLGVSFTYPTGFFAVEDLNRKVINVRNTQDLPTESETANFQSIGISYDKDAAAYESVVSGLKGSQKTEVVVSGGTVRLYTYQNPSYPDRTLAMAFFSGKHNFTVNMAWSAYNSSQEEATREANEVALIKQLVPTIVISK